MKLVLLIGTVFALFSSVVNASCLSHGQIMSEIRGFVASHGGEPGVITEVSPIYFVATNLVAAWEDLDNIPRFRSCGLTLGPNDLRFVTTVGELAGVIMWNMNLRTKFHAASTSAPAARCGDPGCVQMPRGCICGDENGMGCRQICTAKGCYIKCGP
jgi:hypothetical protein